MRIRLTPAQHDQHFHRRNAVNKGIGALRGIRQGRGESISALEHAFCRDLVQVPDQLCALELHRRLNGGGMGEKLRQNISGNGQALVCAGHTQCPRTGLIAPDQQTLLIVPLPADDAQRAHITAGLCGLRGLIAAGLIMDMAAGRSSGLCGLHGRRGALRHLGVRKRHRLLRSCGLLLFGSAGLHRGVRGRGVRHCGVPGVIGVSGIIGIPGVSGLLGSCRGRRILRFFRSAGIFRIFRISGLLRGPIAAGFVVYVHTRTPRAGLHIAALFRMRRMVDTEPALREDLRILRAAMGRHQDRQNQHPGQRPGPPALPAALSPRLTQGTLFSFHVIYLLEFEFVSIDCGAFRKNNRGPVLTALPGLQQVRMPPFCSKQMVFKEER